MLAVLYTNCCCRVNLHHRGHAPISDGAVCLQNQVLYFKSPHLSLGLISVLCALVERSEFLCHRKLRTVPRSPDTKAPGPPQLINRCVLVPSQAQPLKWESRGPIIVKNWKLNIGFISLVIKGPWNWFNAAALLLGGFLQREHKTMSSSHLLINPPNPAKLISHHNFARN